MCGGRMNVAASPESTNNCQTGATFYILLMNRIPSPSWRRNAGLTPPILKENA